MPEDDLLDGVEYLAGIQDFPGCIGMRGVSVGRGRNPARLAGCSADGRKALQPGPEGAPWQG